MNIKYLAAWGIIPALILAMGCTTSLKQNNLLDQNWGRSFQAAKFDQTLTPDAENNLEPVTGLAGSSAEKAVQQYEESFADSCEAQSSYNINLSGIGKK